MKKMMIFRCLALVLVSFFVFSGLSFSAEKAAVSAEECAQLENDFKYIEERLVDCRGYIARREKDTTKAQCKLDWVNRNEDFLRNLRVYTPELERAEAEVKTWGDALRSLNKERRNLICIRERLLKKIDKCPQDVSSHKSDSDKDDSPFKELKENMRSLNNHFEEFAESARELCNLFKELEENRKKFFIRELEENRRRFLQELNKNTKLLEIWQQ